MAELSKLGRYQLRRILGKGAMGVVYDGYDPTINRRVAVKIILKSHGIDEEMARAYSARFVREAQAAGRINHPNIVQVYDFGEQEDIAYLVMEFIQGRELRSFFSAKEQFEIRESVRIMGELLDALDFAHEAGVIHRDVKPANVMLDSQRRVKLADFGVARIQDSERSAADTMVGTPAYMSPEQISGKKIDRRTDIFSAGSILYQLLTGEQPFKGEGAWTVAKQIMQDDPPLPSSVTVSVSPAFDEIVNKALAKEPAQRYGSAREFAVALKGVLAGDRPLPARAKGKPGGPAGPSASDTELEYWRSIQQSNDPEELELYLREFPSGAYAQLARHKIAKLRGVAPEATGAAAKQAQEQEPREMEEAARREGEVRAKLAEEKAKLEAELVKREVELAAKRQAEAKARQKELERMKKEAEALAAKREVEAKATYEAEMARREAEAKARRETEEKARREAEEKARKEAEARSKAEADARAKREAEKKAWREAEEKARKEAEEKARRAAEELAKRQAEMQKREAELKIRDAKGPKPKTPIVPIVIAVLVAAIGVGVWYAIRPKVDLAQIEELRKSLEAANQAALEARKAADAAKQQLELARQGEEAARKAGDAARLRELTEQTKLREAALRKQEELVKQREAGVQKQTEATKQQQAELAKLQAERKKQADAKKQAEQAKQTAAAKQAEAANQREAEQAEQAAMQKAAAAKAAEAEKAAAAKTQVAPFIDSETGAIHRTEKAAAAEKAAAEKVAAAKTAAVPTVPSAPGASAVGVDTLLKQAAALEGEGKMADAVRLYIQAARAGSGPAAKRLGDIYYNGAPGVSPDYGESIKWHNLARRRGVEVGPAGR